MAVNIAEIGTVYDALETKIVGTLTTEYDAGRLKGKEYSEVMTAAISALISSSVSSVLEQPVKAAQVNLIEEQITASTAETAVKEAMKTAQVLDMKVKDFVMLAESEKERELKDAQVLLAQSQVTYENAKIESLGIHDAIDQATNKADIALKGSQKILIDKQQLTEASKKELTDRQSTGYDDQRRVKKAEILNNSVGMFGAGGTTVPAGFTEAALAAATAI